MIDMKAIVNGDGTQVEIQLSAEASLTLTTDKLEEFIAVLRDIRSRMRTVPIATGTATTIGISSGRPAHARF
jgi:hypothetical protein